MSDLYRRDSSRYPSGDIGMLQWAYDFKNPELKIVKQETLPDGRFLSTVWLGLNHSFREGPPLIFETMLFPSESDAGVGPLACRRYSTEAEGLAGHEAIKADFI